MTRKRGRERPVGEEEGREALRFLGGLRFFGVLRETERYPARARKRRGRWRGEERERGSFVLFSFEGSGRVFCCFFFHSFSSKKRTRKEKNKRFRLSFSLSYLSLFSALLFSSFFRDMPPRTRRGAAAADESDGDKQVRSLALFESSLRSLSAPAGERARDDDDAISLARVPALARSHSLVIILRRARGDQVKVLRR